MWTERSGDFILILRQDDTMNDYLTRLKDPNSYWDFWIEDDVARPDRYEHPYDYTYPIISGLMYCDTDVNIICIFSSRSASTMS